MKLNYKTQKRLNNPLMARILEEAVDNFIQFSHEEAEMVIFEITCTPEIALQKMGFPKGISKEQALIIRKELANQYRTKHEDWSFGQVFVNREEGKTFAAQELIKALGNDFYLFDTIMGYILQLSYHDEHTIEHALRCLKSKNANSQFGGIRALYFPYDVAEFLLPYANQIGAVLEEITEEKMNRWYDSSKSYERHQQIKTVAGLKISSKPKKIEKTPIEEAPSEEIHIKEAPSEETSTAPIAVAKEANHEVHVNTQNGGIKTEKVLLAGNFFASYSNVREHAECLLKNRQQINAFFQAYDNMKNNIDVNIDLLLKSPELVDSLMEIFM